MAHDYIVQHFFCGLSVPDAGFTLPLEDLYLGLVFHALETVGKFVKLSADGLAPLTTGLTRFSC